MSHPVKVGRKHFNVKTLLTRGGATCWHWRNFFVAGAIGNDFLPGGVILGLRKYGGVGVKGRGGSGKEFEDRRKIPYNNGVTQE
jgi:hypothetical protein